MIDVPVMFSDQGDEIPKSGEFSDWGIGFCKVHLFIPFNYYACFVSYGALRIVFRVVHPFGANWLDLQFPCFLGVDSCERVIE